MNTIVPRTCTEIPDTDEKQSRENVSGPLKAFRDRAAYVLLGDPGAGKTTAFRREATRQGGFYVSARDFMTFEDRPDWHGTTLFIDGLDEVRAQRDVITPFDEVRRRLDALGRPRFRLSCRVADWLGTNDRKHLTSVSPDGAVTVLRLNPLTESDIVRILNGRSDIDDVGAFIAEARERSVDGLLKNPQSLKMLADVVAQDGEWPESRLKTFEKACSQLVREHNEKHEIAMWSDPKKLLNAAGRLCAVQLISGAVGYTLRGQLDDEYPALDQCDYDSRDALRSALSTKLFKAESEGRFTPVHRHIAEFLGARHLAQRIDDGLPSRRILGLITGEDGIVVTEMRGLSAWLAAHCKNARADLIERDPIGVGLYGDIHRFSLDEKHTLLKALNREVSRLDSEFSTATAFGPLATSDMEPEFRKVLNDSSREKEHQLFADFVLNILCHGSRLPNLAEILLGIVRDDTWWSRLNISALNAFIHNCSKGVEKTRKLKTLLADVQVANVSDPDNELLGILLIQLYTHGVSPEEVWNYLHDTGKQELFFGMYEWFWQYSLVQKSSDEQVAELLDILQQRLPGLRPALESRLYLERLPLRLLARGLRSHGEAVETKRLYDWLSAGFSEIHGVQSSDENAIHEIRSWLEQRPEVQKKVIAEGLNRCSESDSDGFDICALKVEWRLYGANPPPDFGLWCLEQAVAMADAKPRVAKHLLRKAVSAYKNQFGSEGLSLDLLIEYAETNEVLQTTLDQLCAPQPIPRKNLDQTESYIEEQERQEEQWINYVRSNEAALRENRAPHILLYQIAIRYFGDSINIHKDLRGDKNLIDAARLGIRGVIEREDVPDVEEILALREKGHMHYLCWPFLAALAEIEESTPEKLCRLDANQIRRALAFHFCSANSQKLNWYQRLLKSHPEIVAEVQIRFAVSEFRGGRENISKLWALAHDRDHAQVARHASLPLLHAFPIRCKLSQINLLDNLLWAALQHADRASLEELVEQKLSRTSMNSLQRVRWLAAAVVVSSEAHTARLRTFVQGRERRIRFLAGFFPSSFPRSDFSLSQIELEIPVIELLIRLVGSYLGPYEWKDKWNAEKEDSELVRALIQRLAASPDKDASDALDSLLADPTLSRWRDVLSQARDSQSVIRRDAGYRHPDIEQVCRTLNGGSPANAADLAALVMDRLCEIADQIRTGNTDDWRQYWNEDADKKHWRSKPENSCRDALLSDLRKCLPQGVDAQPEGQYARDRRADIRVSHQDFQMPVEVKKDSHRDLWSALQNQLIAQYASDPTTGGYGIYLVFWFGKDHTRLPPSGTRPESPQDLEKQLKATLSEDEARKISVCVIDVSSDG